MNQRQAFRNMDQLLNEACENGHLKKVTALLTIGECDVNACNTAGETPLHIACEYGHLEIVKVLLKKCDLNVQNSASA